MVTAPKKLETIGIKRLVSDALWVQGVRKKSQLNKNRYEFQADHGFRKWFKTRCEPAGMRSINIEILMGHSIGISDSYYRITENELLADYSKAVDLLTINSDNSILNKQIQQLEEKNKENEMIIQGKFQEKGKELEKLRQQEIINKESITLLSDQIALLMTKMALLENK